MNYLMIAILFAALSALYLAVATGSAKAVNCACVAVLGVVVGALIALLVL